MQFDFFVLLRIQMILSRIFFLLAYSELTYDIMDWFSFGTIQFFSRLDVLFLG